MVKRYSFLLLKAEIHANPSSNFLQCTDKILYSLNCYKVAGYYSTRLSLMG
jgi:hypothetical protein